MDNKATNLVPHKDVKSHVSEDLVYGILLRLPAKSICRFRCVSTSFRALIDRQFFDKQLEDKIYRKLIFKERTTQNDRVTAFYVCSIDGGLEQKILFRNQQKNQLYLCSGYNGLLLLSDGYSNFVLWNPFTKQYKNLTPGPLERRNCRGRMGFGYDSASDDYKVVLVDPESTWIFGLRSNSWRRIDCELCPDIGDVDRWSVSAYFAHGNLHWLYGPPKSSHVVQKIFAFDVAKEKLSQVTMPPVYSAGGRVSDLYVVKECLCVAVSYFYSAGGDVHLYVRNKGGDDYTWSRLWSMQLRSLEYIEDLNYVKIVGYSEERDEILLDIGLDEWNTVKRKYMISYDLEGKLLSIVDFPAEEYALGWEPRMFVPSFVPVGDESTGAWKPLKEEIYDEEEF